MLVRCVLFVFIFKTIQMHSRQNTPQIAPIDHDPSQITLTPLHKALAHKQHPDLLEDFFLDTPKDTSGQQTAPKRRKKSRHFRKGLLGEGLEGRCELQLIVEEQESQWEREEDSWESSSLDVMQAEDLCYVHSNTVATHLSFRSISAQACSAKDTEDQKVSTIDSNDVDYSLNIQRFMQAPKTELIKQIREIQNQSESDQVKKQLIKELLEKYLLDCQTFVFQQAWSQLEGLVQSNVRTIIKGIELTFAKKIGGLSFENRRVKLLKYLEKKKKRIWRKKVSYDCRKKVADGRLRIKGKFVTREQVCEQLGLPSLQAYSPQEIKLMLDGQAAYEIVQE